MPWWMSRLAWRCRRKRLVRLHLEVQPGTPSTVEGVRLGVWGGHYVLMLPKVLEAADRTHALEGVLEVPRGRVVFVQVLS
jgi:hypothetical protein